MASFPLLADLLARKERAIEQLCADKEEEGLHLEFKTLEGASGGPLHGHDKQLLGKAISGLANAEGGLIVIGVLTAKREELDFADRPTPMENASRVRNRITSFLPEVISPIHSGLQAHLIPSAKGGDLGYVVIEVPASDARPHMSNRERRYYRRGSDRTKMMEHSEVRDLFFAERSARLRPTSRFVEGPALGNHARELHLVYGIENEGGVAARNAFLRVNTSPRVAVREHGHGRAKWERPDGAMMFDSGESAVLHVGDVIEIARIVLTLAPEPPRRYAPAPEIPHLSFYDMNSSKYWHMSARQPSGGTVPLPNGLEVVTTIGAENATAQTFKLSKTIEDGLGSLDLSHDKLNTIFGQKPA